MRSKLLAAATAAALTAAALMAAWIPQQANAATATISAVTIAWSDSTHQSIRVRWTETTPVANTVQLNWRGLVIRDLGTTTAADPNEFLVQVGEFGGFQGVQDTNTIIVKDPVGGSAASPGFDAFLPQALAVPAFAADGQVRWTIQPTPPDPTPGDPLDVDEPIMYKVDVFEYAPAVGCQITTVSNSTATTGLIPRRAKPYELETSARNEWGVQADFPDVQHGTVGLTSAALAAPGSTPYGASTIISGVLLTSLPTLAIHAGPCDEGTRETPNTTVSLQARNTPAGAWYVVANQVTNSTGNFSFTVRNPGGREYRVTSGDRVVSDLSIVYGGSSPTKLVRATTKLQSAKFISPIITYGTKPQAYLWVDPPGSQRAALQFKNTSGVWQGVTYKTLSSGRGIASFSWNRRGTTQFRWWVPGTTTSTGLTVNPIYTGAFALTVR